jgi:CRISPR-associated endonuclease Csn1
LILDGVRHGHFDIDHILPYSKTLDDGFMNKVLCSREANRRKGNGEPAYAWSGEALAGH